MKVVFKQGRFGAVKYIARVLNVIFCWLFRPFHSIRHMKAASRSMNQSNDIYRDD
jgi:hypothetical protein